MKTMFNPGDKVRLKTAEELYEELYTPINTIAKFKAFLCSSNFFKEHKSEVFTVKTAYDYAFTVYECLDYLNYDCFSLVEKAQNIHPITDEEISSLLNF